MRRYRIALIGAGALLLAFGVFRLVTNLEAGDLFALLAWLLAAVVLHDLVIAPLTVGAGVVLTRLPPRARGYVQGVLVVAAVVTVIAIPLIYRSDSQPAVKAILLRDYGSNLLLLLALIVAVGVLLYLARRAREVKAHSGSRLAGEEDSGEA